MVPRGAVAAALSCRPGGGVRVHAGLGGTAPCALSTPRIGEACPCAVWPHARAGGEAGSGRASDGGGPWVRSGQRLRIGGCDCGAAAGGVHCIRIGGGMAALAAAARLAAAIAPVVRAATSRSASEISEGAGCGAGAACTGSIREASSSASLSRAAMLARSRRSASVMRASTASSTRRGDAPRSCRPAAGEADTIQGQRGVLL
eukprot:scaffold28272_cov101-Isochrysis_galbana.AAC.1